MNWFKQLFSRRRIYNDLSAEIQAHIEEKADELVTSGMPRKEATAAARREFGNVTLMAEDSRAVWQWPSIESFFADVRYGARMLRRNPSATAVMVFTLALAIGATTAIFSVVYGVLVRPLPYADSSRIMAVFEVNSNGGWSHLADPNFDDFRDQNRSFQTMAKYNYYVVSVSGAAQPSRTTVAHVSPEFLKVFGVQPIIGRDFRISDSKKGAAPVVLASYGYWRQYLEASPDLSQAHLKIDGAVFSVIGVLPAGFQFPPEVSLWLPADLEGENQSRTAH